MAVWHDGLLRVVLWVDTELWLVLERVGSEADHVGCHGSLSGREVCMEAVGKAVEARFDLDELSADVCHVHEARGSERLLWESHRHGVGPRRCLNHGFRLLAQVLEDARVAIGTACSDGLDRFLHRLIVVISESVRTWLGYWLMLRYAVVRGLDGCGGEGTYALRQQSDSLLPGAAHLSYC